MCVRLNGNSPDCLLDPNNCYPKYWMPKDILHQKENRSHYCFLRSKYKQKSFDTTSNTTSRKQVIYSFSSILRVCVYGNFRFDSLKKNNLVQFNIIQHNFYIDLCLIYRRATAKYSQKKRDEWNRNKEKVQTRLNLCRSEGHVTGMGVYHCITDNLTKHL